MPHEKIERLEQKTNEQGQKISLLENGFNSIKPLFEKIDKLTEAMILNTASHNEVIKMQERLARRQDATELDSRALHDEIAAARPAIKLMNELSKKMMYFGFFMIVLSLGVAAYVIKA